MEYSSTISAFQKILSTYVFNTDASDFPEDFAVKRYLKKMEIPDDAKLAERRKACFETYVSFDKSLRLPRLLPGNWYKARILIHQWCSEFRLDPMALTNGSEAHPTRGRNSIESKLMRSVWECTPECWEQWATTAYETLALKRSTRARFSAIMGHDGYAIKSFHKDSYRMFADRKNFKFLCFARMLSRVTFVRQASRFSTVRKNNEKDRPIDVQPLCNMLVQRRIGNGLRSLLKNQGVDLNSLADSHRRMISDNGLATIDLQNASDSIHLSLIKFLFPKRVYDLIEASRTYYTEGLDGEYYVTNKVSAMGNGFTFELMTVVIRALGLQYEPDFSVFGDDIIIKNRSAELLIKDLESVGFLVNKSKTFINLPFRESCGGNFHDQFGYIESYDFEYPHSIHDCVVLSNKAYVLGLKYPQFRKLSLLLLRAVPHALHGPAFSSDPDGNGTGRQGYNQDVHLSTTFWTIRSRGVDWDNPVAERKLRSLHYEPSNFKKITGFRWKPELASPRRNNLTMRRNTGKYFMYLHGRRISDDIVTGCGSWQSVAYLTDGVNLFRLKSLLD